MSSQCYGVRRSVSGLVAMLQAKGSVSVPRSSIRHLSKSSVTRAAGATKRCGEMNGSVSLSRQEMTVISFRLLTCSVALYWVCCTLLVLFLFVPLVVVTAIRERNLSTAEKNKFFLAPLQITMFSGKTRRKG